MLRRILRAAKLEPELFEEVEADQGATIEAVVVVILSSLAAGVGLTSTVGGVGFFWGTVAALVGWLLWAVLIFFIGTKWLPAGETHTDMGELLRTLGFSSAPGVIRIFGIFHPTLSGFLGITAFLWTLLAMVVAVKHVLDYPTTGRAMMVVGIAGFIQLLLFGGLYFLITLTLGGGPTP